MIDEYLEVFDTEQFKEMTEYILNNFSNFGKIREYKKDDFINFNADKEIIIFESGELDLGLIDISGKERLLYKYKYRGTVIGDSDIFSSKGKNYSIKFIKNTKLRFISKKEVQSFLDLNPIAYKYFLKSVVRSYNISLTYLIQNRFYSSEEKIIEFLLRIAAAQEPNIKKDVVIENYTHKSIGSFTNTSRYLVSNILKSLEKIDLIEIKFKKIILKDIDELDLYREKIRE